MSRREWFHRSSGGFAATAFAALWNQVVGAADPLAPHAGHFPAHADNIIFIYSTGGVSHVDTFDYKPHLFADHGKKINAS
ncbi:MAG: DUF1501 domain-containing protein, partial [Planctomycetota bacterium]